MTKRTNFLAFMFSIILLNTTFFSALAQHKIAVVPQPNNVEWVSSNGVPLYKINKVFFTHNKLKNCVRALNASFALLKLPPLSIHNYRSKRQGIFLIYDSTLDATDEHYSLNITSKKIIIKGNEKGCYYGIQSLHQLLQEAINSNQKLPKINVNDSPAFAYRGLLLDVSRHFFSVQEIKKIMDVMSHFKLNTFHWHLTDDQGWRIEIKKYPLLTSVGSVRKQTMIEKNFPPNFIGDNKVYGPYFYTQDQVKDIVKYAKKRNINILPEIDLPGHSMAAIAAYPFLGYDGKPQEVSTVWGVMDDGVLNVGKDSVYNFLQNVLDEIIPLFPYPYIHIGGDEVPKIAWANDSITQQKMKNENLKNEVDLHNYFTNRIEKYVNAKGRKIIGWDEILEGEVSPTASIMSWRGESGGIYAANKNHNVIMSPGKPCYLDHFQSNYHNEPLAIGGLNTLENVYQYNPLPKDIKQENAKYVLGAQANLWTEYISTNDYAEYMLFPRAIALAEATWTRLENKSYDHFVSLLDNNFLYLNKKNVAYANHVLGIQKEFSISNNQLFLKLFSINKDCILRYNINEKSIDSKSKIYKDSILINKDMSIKAQLFKNNKAYSFMWKQNIVNHQAFAKNITLKTPPSIKFNGTLGASTLVNGIWGNENYSDNEWLGFYGDSLEATIDLQKESTIQSVAMNFIFFPISHIYLPQQVVLYGSHNGVDFEKLCDKSPAGTTKIVTYKHTFATPQQMRYLKVKATNLGIIPKFWHGAGKKALLLIDEILVK